MGKPIRTAVIGVGYFGRFHARHYAANPDAELVAVVDEDMARAEEVAQEFGAEPFGDYRALAGKVDAASIAVPTSMHAGVARELVEAGIHLLVEKPITDNVEDGEALVDLAAEKGCVLQVGHIERYSAAFRALSEKITRPLFIESYRISPWNERANEVDVVLDLMIHDIDIIQGLVASPVTSVHAVGAPVVNPTEDLANARIVFENGCVANVTASRISIKTERTMRIFQQQSYVVCDFGKGRISSYTHDPDSKATGIAAIKFDTVDIPKEDSLGNEIADFLECIRSGRTPMVDGRAGVEALRVARMITDTVRDHRRYVEGLLQESVAE